MAEIQRIISTPPVPVVGAYSRIQQRDAKHPDKRQAPHHSFADELEAQLEQVSEDPVNLPESPSNSPEDHSIDVSA